MQKTARAAWDLAASLSLYTSIGLVVYGVGFLLTDPEASTDAQGGLGLFVLLIGFPWIFCAVFLLIWPPLALTVAWRCRAELFDAEHPVPALAYRVLLPMVTWVWVVRQLVVAFTSMES